MATIEDFMTIADVDTIKVMADERRLAILAKLQKSMTVKELAEQLDCPVSQLYYHVNMLERHGLIQVVATQVISGIIEKQYQVTAKVFRIRNPLLMGEAISAEESSTIFAGLLDETKHELQRSFRLLPPPPDTQPPLHPFVTKREVRLTQEQIRQIHGRLDELVKECKRLTEENAGKEAELFGLTVAFYRDAEAQSE